MCSSTPQSGTTVQTHKGSHHVLQTKLLQNFFSSSNKFSQNVFWTFLQFSPRTVSTRPHKYVLSDAQKCWFVLVLVAGPDLRTNMQWKNTWLVSSLICLDTSPQMALVDQKESEPGSCGHSAVASAPASNMEMVRSSTATKPSSPETREARNLICTSDNGW